MGDHQRSSGTRHGPATPPLWSVLSFSLCLSSVVSDIFVVILFSELEARRLVEIQRAGRL